jgi:hypothetical protein
MPIARRLLPFDKLRAGALLAVTCEEEEWQIKMNLINYIARRNLRLR